VIFIGEGKRLVTFSTARDVCFWETETGKPLPKYTLAWKHACPADLVNFNPSERQDGLLNFASNRDQVLVCGPANNVRLVDLVTGGTIKAMQFDYEFEPSATLSPSGNLVAIETITRDLKPKQRIHVLDLRANTQVQVFEVGTIPDMGPPRSMPGRIAFSAKDRFLASPDQESGIFVWNVDSGAVVHRLPGVPRRPAGSLAFAPNGRYLVASTSTFLYEGSGRANVPDATLHLWDLATGRKVGTLGGGGCLV
jgi:WD40 repeat protein